ncbi:response regulator [Shouchella clausii]
MIQVLIVEDDPMVAAVVKSYLRDVPGFQVAAEAGGVEEAKQHLKKNKTIQLVLLDVYMPGENGLSLLPYLRENKIEADVILMTAASDKESIETALRFGAVDYILKPYQFARFQKALHAYQSRYNFFRKEETTDQKQLDETFFEKKHTLEKQTLPKGLTKETLQEVWEAIRQVGQDSFSTEDIALHARLSRVSVKKYLTFLKELDVLQLQPTYGSIGRPIHIYRIDKDNVRKLKPYL